MTKGDANECSIPSIDFPITISNYIGTVVKVNSEYVSDSDTQTKENHGVDNSTNNQSNPTDIQALISNLANLGVPSAAALGEDVVPNNIIEFGDYQDPFSARFNQETKDELISKYVDSRITRFGFNDFILIDL
ncbi:MAG: DsbA family protein [Candidatus Nitrosocosmicus sp.]|nr:DsbA family protein [Candidatus Nitrosocosmicus sp.]MDN5866783.1 DsbA family protein [Candidatus Nitrosocosmicus sp.]